MRLVNNKLKMQGIFKINNFRYQKVIDILKNE